MIHPLMSIQGLQLVEVLVSMTISSIYSCDPDGPLENSLITRVWDFTEPAKKTPTKKNEEGFLYKFFGKLIHNNEYNSFES